MLTLTLSEGCPPGLGETAWSELFKLVTDAYPCARTAERRRDRRYPFPFPVHVTPVDDDGITPLGEPIVAAGKDLSESGLAFYHPVPLSCRRVVVSIERKDGRRLEFLLELKRSRSILPGWYQSSGRFVESVAVSAERA